MHIAMDIWTPVEDKMPRQIPEPTNSVDRNAVAVIKDGHIVGLVCSLQPIPHYLTVLGKGCKQSQLLSIEELDMGFKYLVFTTSVDQSLILTSYVQEVIDSLKTSGLV